MIEDIQDQIRLAKVADGVICFFRQAAVCVPPLSQAIAQASPAQRVHAQQAINKMSVDPRLRRISIPYGHPAAVLDKNIDAKIKIAMIPHVIEVSDAIAAMFMPVVAQNSCLRQKFMVHGILSAGYQAIPAYDVVSEAFKQKDALNLSALYHLPKATAAPPAG